MVTDKMNLVQQILQLPPGVGSPIHRAQAQDTPSVVGHVIGMHGCHKARTLSQRDLLTPATCRQSRDTTKAILGLGHSVYEIIPFCSSPCL